MQNKKVIVGIAILCINIAVVFGVAQVFFLCVGSNPSAFSYNPIAREFGGTIIVNLEPNRKLVNISWKSDNSLWILTRKMRVNEEAEEYEYKEDSTFGVFEGTVIIKESR